MHCGYLLPLLASSTVLALPNLVPHIIERQINPRPIARPNVAIAGPKDPFQTPTPEQCANGGIPAGGVSCCPIDRLYGEAKCCPQALVNENCPGISAEEQRLAEKAKCPSANRYDTGDGQPRCCPNPVMNGHCDPRAIPLHRGPGP